MMVIVTGTANVVPVGPNSNADEATRAAFANMEVAGATVTAVLAGSAPTGITTVAALLDDFAVPPAVPMPPGVADGAVDSLHDATVKVNVAATRSTCDSRMRLDTGQGDVWRVLIAPTW